MKFKAEVARGPEEPESGGGLVRFAVERRVTMMMVLAGILVLGWMSLKRLPLEFLPAFSSSSISVSVNYPSSAPQEVERLIVHPLEDAFSDISGIETIAANASADSGSVRLTFIDGTDMDMAAVDVRDRLDRVRHRLPEDVDRVRIRRFQSTDIPIMRFHVSSAMERQKLFDFMENVLQRRLERLEGVAQVEISGLRTPQVQVNLDPARMQAHRVSVRDLVSQLRSENRNLSAGKITDGRRELVVRAIGEFAGVDEVRTMPIGKDGLVLADVADVDYTYPRQDDFNFLNGVESMTVRVNKVSTANLLGVVDRVRAELDAIAALPEAAGINVRIYSDFSTDVRMGLAQLRNAGLFGAGLAIMAVFLFLRRFRTTALIAVAIPVSVVGTFVMMYFLRAAKLSDITLNVVSLAGLMLALGMLVDNSVVVIESIFRHRNEWGQDAKTAALRGTADVALPITAATVTTLCVFLPVIFFDSGGRMQIYLKSIATTVSIVIAVSLFVALTIVPLAATVFLKKQEARSSTEPGWLTRTYGRVLAFTLHHRLLFMVVIVSLLWGAIELFGSIERSFSARSEERQVTLHVDTPRQYSLEQTEALYAELYELFDTHREELEIQDITYSYDRSTGRSRGGHRGDRRFTFFLVDEEESSLTTYDVRERVRGMLPVKAGVGLRIAQGEGRGGSTGVEVQISGEDPVVLGLLTDRLVERLQALETIRDVDTSLDSGDKEIRVEVNRERVLAAGLSSQVVASTVSNSLSSRPVSQYKTGDREVDIVVQYAEDERETLDQLKNVPVFANGSQVPLGSMADFQLVPGPRNIERENRRSMIQITANATSPRATFAALGVIRQTMTEFSMPPGYEWSFGRWSRINEKDAETGWFAFGFAIVLVYLLMAALFESFAQPFTIMFSVPFALLGVAVVLKLTDQPLDTMSNIGLIILLGVVVNNAIVLIDHINQLRSRGMSREEAIITGGRHRLRPILITAVTTLLGLAPLVAPIILPQWFGPLEGRAGTWAPIGLVIMGGLTTSTFLTLLIIPTVYTLMDDLSVFIHRVRAAL